MDRITLYNAFETILDSDPGAELNSVIPETINALVDFVVDNFEQRGRAGNG